MRTRDRHKTHTRVPPLGVVLGVEHDVYSLPELEQAALVGLVRAIESRKTLPKTDLGWHRLVSNLSIKKKYSKSEWQRAFFSLHEISRDRVRYAAILASRLALNTVNWRKDPSDGRLVLRRSQSSSAVSALRAPPAVGLHTMESPMEPSATFPGEEVVRRGRPPKKGKRTRTANLHRLQIKLSEQSLDRLERLRLLTHAASSVDVIRQALRVYEMQLQASPASSPPTTRTLRVRSKKRP
jgi:hypothetical protein